MVVGMYWVSYNMVFEHIDMYVWFTGTGTLSRTQSVSSGIHDRTKERANKKLFLFLSLNLLTE
jgi:hypothetical protein